MPRKIMLITGLIFLILIGSLVFKSVKGFLPVPIWMRHLIHLMAEPKNLYQPIIVDKFLFYEQGVTKVYNLTPNYFDIYEIGFFVDGTGIEATYKFKGKIKAEFYWKDNLLFDRMITSMDQGWYKENDMSHYKQISLMKFEIPLLNRYAKDISIKLTVIDPDLQTKSLGDSINLYIGVSASP
jgi:hypothetical protein